MRHHAIWIGVITTTLIILSVAIQLGVAQEWTEYFYPELAASGKIVLTPITLLAIFGLGVSMTVTVTSLVFSKRKS